VSIDLWTVTSLAFAISGEEDPLLASGDAFLSQLGKVRLVFVASPGSNRVIRLAFFPGAAAPSDYAETSLDDGYNKVSTMVYVDPYLFFGTNAPSAALGSIYFWNFCGVNGSGSSGHSYCDTMVWHCKDGYTMESKNPDVNGFSQCTPNPLDKIIRVVVLSSTLAITFGVLMGVNILVGGFAWVSWYRIRRPNVPEARAILDHKL